MKYQNFDAVAFASDEYFQSWVLEPNKEINSFWESYLLENPSKQQIIVEARNLVLSLKVRDNREIHKERLLRVKKKVLSSTRNESKHVKGIFYKWSVSIAASLLLILTAGYFILNNIDAWYQDTTIDTQRISYVEKVTTRGQKSTLKLPDGSTVKLNAESKLRIPDNFDIEERVVFLEGEAFFSIARDTTKPFKILTGEITTQVLGTSFNVNAYDFEKISVAVVTGKVAVENQTEKEKQFLMPGEILFAEDGHLGEKQNYDIETLTSWKDGILLFKENRLADVVIKLESWFDVTITMNDMVNDDLTYTGKFDNESLENILLAISEIAKFKFEIRGREVTIFN